MAKSKAIRVRHLSLAEARASLNKIVQRAHGKGEYLFVGKEGTPVIGIMDADELEVYLELRDPAVQAKIRKSNEDIRAGRTRPAAQLLEEARKELSLRSRTHRRQKK